MTVAINTVTAICFALLTLAVVYVIVSVVKRNRAERIAFIRSFKKGKCAAIFLIAVPLFFLGYFYTGVNFFESILSGITHVVGLVVLKFNLDDVPELLAANLFYKITIYYCCVLVTLNAVLFALSLTSQRLWQWRQRLKLNCTKKDKLYVFGNNKDNLSIYKSDKVRSCVIVDKISDVDAASMYVNKINFCSTRNFNGVVDNVFKTILKKNNKITLVINTEDDEKNLKLARYVAQKIKQCDAVRQARLFDMLDVHVFGDPKYEAIYEDVVADSFGCVHYKNKYRMLAMDFVDKYPFSKFMDARHVDYNTALLRSDVDVNVCMIGFGKPNRQIFLTSVANNQFVAATNDGIALKQVNYHVFDKVCAENNKGLNHSYYRFGNECTDVNEADYLPLPQCPAHEDYYHVDVNEPTFYNKIRDIITAKKNDVNFIIVSFENDLENIDMAQKLVEKSREWGVDNLVIFVRVKSIGNVSLFADKNVFLIGNESDCVYNIHAITNDAISRMAQMRNEIYELEYKITNDKDFVVNAEAIQSNRAQAKKNWYVTKSQLERESSLYCCLSMQSKLNLMGLAYCKADENDLTPLTESEYLACYADGDVPDTFGLEADGKKVVKYTLDFPESKRKTLAILEHLRWNSFMISHGVIPASKEQILSETAERDGKMRHTNGKNYLLRRHGNLTTFDGLVEFRKMVAERDGGDEADYDVIKYDYQLLDDAYWLLTKNGFKIVRREK